MLSEEILLNPPKQAFKPVLALSWKPFKSPMNSLIVHLVIFSFRDKSWCLDQAATPELSVEIITKTPFP